MAESYYEESVWPDYGWPTYEQKFCCIRGCKGRCPHCILAWGIKEKAKKEDKK